MILHILQYDQKTGKQFAAYVIGQFSRPEYHSKFTIMSSPDCSWNYYEWDSVSFIDPDNHDQLAEFIGSLSSYNAIVFHGLFFPWCETVLRSIPQNVKIAWEFWGGEIYGRSDLVRQMMASFTHIVSTLRSKYKQKDSIVRWELPIELYQRIEYCLTAQAEEYDFAKKYIHSSHLKHLWYTYYSVEETVGDLINSQCDGENLWFCHNANVESNALDALIRFVFSNKYRRQIKNASVIMPLSYGEPWIRNIMLKLGPLAFGHRFIPLNSFLEREKYNGLMLKCSAMVLPGYRPAGQGNIITALWLGMRVYLSEKCLSYLFFKRIGITIFSFESDFPKYGCARISEEEMKENRLVLYKTFGRDSIDKAVAHVVSALS